MNPRQSLIAGWITPRIFGDAADCRTRTTKETTMKIRVNHQAWIGEDGSSWGATLPVTGVITAFLAMWLATAIVWS